MAAHQLRHGSNFTGKRGSNTVSTQQAGRGPGIKRRTIVQGVAWSVPVVVAAQALPAFATSPADLTGSIGSVCKYPGSSTSANCKQDYRASVTFKNNNGTPTDTTQVTILSATFGTTNMPCVGIYTTGGQLLDGTTPYTFDLSASQGSVTFNLVFDGSNSANIQNSNFCVNWEYQTWQNGGGPGSGTTYTPVPICLFFASTPPACGGACGT